ncbi:hypothetical protein EV363DRAFT_1429853 [Boletus edulis]|uniref:CUE domain-containing protein n=1 Tax=Boletus edulis BED1 TaxID=1328754 RepID=A0AAD4C1X6_BOLED|nr:hypothetical protein EV363DRAFT_1429853 [Boletus edulis]KAF8445071.1 hypothetical protein L210DRAFT_1058874 [Boletus edulis BED1]
MILSPSPPPQSTQPVVHAQPPMQSTDPTSEDPHVASLKAIFPDFDDAVILSVLETTNNDHDHALDVLLGMNDPSFVPPNPPSAQAPNQFQSAPSSDAQRLSQEELDEQLARRLAFEEQHAATQAWQPQSVEGQTIYQPYQPRRGGRNGWGVQPQGPPQTQGQGGRDTMAEFQEGFNRIAESGKKTFSSIVSKVKAKMQEYDQGSGLSWPQNPPPDQSSQTAPASTSYSSYSPAQQQGSEQGAYAQPYRSAQPANPQRQTSQSQPAHQSTYVSSPPRSEVLRPAAAEPAQSTNSQQPSYYDPNTRGYDLYDDDEEIEINDRRTSAAPAAVAASASVTAQSPATPPPADNLASPLPLSDTSSPPSYASRMSSPPSNPGLSTTSPPARSLSPTIVGARGTKPGTPGGVDFSKLGLLPKRPVSLVRPQSPPAAASTVVGTGASLGAPRVAAAHSTSTADSSTDQEEPEFVENPFEDR